MNGRLNKLSPLLQSVATILKNKEIKSLILGGEKYLINTFSELAFNFCSTQNFNLTAEDIKLLKRYRTIILILIDKSKSVSKRKTALAKAPILARKLAHLYITHV